ncbi:MAG: hypothetical protein NTZ46_10680 [Verrucomicrobia bacterium]|nr:hypothetical protein [Verrucomicrobiota bacterium]
MNSSPPINSPDSTLHRGRKRRRKAKSGRLYIFSLFAWLRLIDAATVYYLYPQLSVINKQYLIVSLVTTAVWTTGLLLAIWFRQNWARYLLVLSLLVAVISTLSMIPGLPDAMHPRKQLSMILAITGVYLPVALVLILSKSVHKLTRDEHGVGI